MQMPRDICIPISYEPSFPLPSFESPFVFFEQVEACELCCEPFIVPLKTASAAVWSLEEIVNLPK